MTNESRLPLPYEGGFCTRREHVVTTDEQGTRRQIAPDDECNYACDCGVAMIGNGFVEIRFGLLDHRFPAREALGA